jgi:hypothetical protein
MTVACGRSTTPCNADCLDREVALRKAVLAGLSFTLAGCMTVRIEATDGQITLQRHIGLLRLELPEPNGSVVGTLSGVGLLSTPMGFSAGYTQQRWALIGPLCRAVLWVDGKVDEHVRRVAQELAGVCLIGGND